MYALPLAFLGLQTTVIHMVMWSWDRDGGHPLVSRLKWSLGLLLAMVMLATAILVILDIRDFRQRVIL